VIAIINFFTALRVKLPQKIERPEGVIS